MTFPMGGFSTYTPYQQSNPLFQLGGEVNDEDMRAFQDCMLGTGDGVSACTAFDIEFGVKHGRGVLVEAFYVGI